MFKTIASLLCCFTTHYQSISESPLPLYPHGLTNIQMIKQVGDFELIHAKFVSRLLQELGDDINELCWHKPHDPRAQFINRYMSAIVLRLAELPEQERAQSLESVKLLIPASADEYRFIHGNHKIPKDKPPSQQHHIGKNVCWPLEHKTITERIAQIKSELQSKNF